MKWIYGVETVAGNFHSAARWLNQNHPEWDVITVDVVGNYTLIFYRIPGE
jgi:hypothetical protein